MKTPRWQFGASSLIGTDFVHVAIGVRMTVAEHAVALFVDLIFFEVMCQFNRKDLVLDA